MYKHVQTHSQTCKVGRLVVPIMFGLSGTVYCVGMPTGVCELVSDCHLFGGFIYLLSYLGLPSDIFRCNLRIVNIMIIK